MQQRYTLSTSQKAAAVLIAMGKPRAKQLLKYFKGDELKRMIEAGHALKSLPQTDVDALVGEFEAAFVEGTGIIDSSDAINAIIDDSVTKDEQPATATTKPKPEPAKSPWELIATVDNDVLVAQDSRFGLSGGAGGVDDQGRCSGLDLGILFFQTAADHVGQFQPDQTALGHHLGNAHGPRENIARFGIGGELNEMDHAGAVFFHGLPHF